MRAARWLAAVLFITFLGFFLFPGHTYLQSDTQIYIPMLERLHDPALFTRDIIAVRPHLTFTIYDDVALACRRVTHAGFESILTTEQLLFRALAVLGLILIALRLGLSATQSFFVAAIVSLGATISGPAVLTIEYEPVPRGFAISLIVFALGLIAEEQFLAAGAAAAVAFLYHPPTTLPFWGLAILLVILRRVRWTILAPLAAAVAILAILARIEPAGLERATILRRLDSFEENLQRMRAAYSFVSTWATYHRINYVVQASIAALAFWRLRKFLRPPLRDFLFGLPVLGILSVPLSWMLLEHQHWALIPQWQPARAILFVSLIAALLSAIAAMKATNFAELFLWLTAAFLMPIQHAMVGREIHYRPLLLAAALAVATTILYAIRKEALVLAALIPFVAMPRLVDNYQHIETGDLNTLADWARNNTPQPALFVFPDSRTSLEPGIFRAHSLRGLYVDWKSGGQVNYFPGFAHEWWTRWQEVSKLKPEEFRNLKGVDYVVTKRPIPGAAPVFENPTYSVYATTSSPDSRQPGSRNN
jgi:hypothetical protein